MVPARSCSGVSDVPVISPIGARCGWTKGDRLPTALVGAPGAFVGSVGAVVAEDGGAAGVLAACCAPAPGRLVRSTPPAAAAAPAMSVRRLIGGGVSAMSNI
jgi:hypothetical protein